MALAIVETLSDSPLTPEEPTDVDYRVWDCLTERNATWRYSLLSVDRHFRGLLRHGRSARRSNL